MTVVTGAAPGPTAGPAGENAFDVACWMLGCQVQPYGIEHRLSPKGLEIARRRNARFNGIPDRMIWREQGDIWFYADIKGATSGPDQCYFPVKPDNAERLTAFSAITCSWAVLVLACWDGQFRVATPAEVRTRPADLFGNQLLYAPDFPTLEEWIREYPPYVGGALARHWRRPPSDNVIHLPRAA